MAKRPSLAGATSTTNGVANGVANGVSNSAPTVAPTAPVPSDPTVVLAGMGKAELERLLAAVSQRIKDAGQGA